jgi:Predicted permeases
MRRIERYLIRSVLEMSALVAVVLIGIYSLVLFISDLGETGQHGFSTLDSAHYALLMIPDNAYILLPLVALLGALLGLGSLARQGELTAMRGAGISFLRIGLSALVAGALLGALTYVLGDWVAPPARRAAEQIHAAGGGHVQWLRDADSIVRIGDLRAEDRIADVTVYQMTAGGALATQIAARSGDYQDGAWMLHDVRRTDFSAGSTEVEHQPTMRWGGGVTPRVLRLFILEENSLTVTGLLRLIRYLDVNHLDAQKYRLLLWRKLVEPFSVMVMVLFSVPFVSGRLRSSGAGTRLLGGILVGAAFYVANKVSVSLGEIYDWNAALSAMAPTLLLAALALWVLRRAR